MPQHELLPSTGQGVGQAVAELAVFLPREVLDLKKLLKAKHCLERNDCETDTDVLNSTIRW